MKEIPLTQGKVALVDDEDFDYLNQWKWCAYEDKKNGVWYAERGTCIGGVQKTFRMHRVILGLEHGDKRQGDHSNHNGLDNRQCNLRICTSRQNQQNQRLQKSKSSQFKGVCFRKKTGRWRAYIQTKKTFKSLGCFQKEEIAALAYDMAAIREHGEFAHLNF